MIICSVRDGSNGSTDGTANCANARFGGRFCAVVTTAPPPVTDGELAPGPLRLAQRADRRVADQLRLGVVPRPGERALVQARQPGLALGIRPPGQAVPAQRRRIGPERVETIGRQFKGPGARGHGYVDHDNPLGGVLTDASAFRWGRGVYW
jgi:hypothetical protein